MTGSAIYFWSNFAFSIVTLPFTPSASDAWKCSFAEQILIYLKRLKASGRNEKSCCLWKMKKQRKNTDESANSLILIPVGLERMQY